MFVDLRCDGDVSITAGEGTNMRYHPPYEKHPEKHQLLLVLDDGSSVSTPIINACGPELLSRMDIAESYKNACAKELQLIEIEPPQGFFDSRPSSIPLKSKYLSLLLGREPITIDEYYKSMSTA